jgi:drug/metabolite transporter (DMT)-like permease
MSDSSFFARKSVVICLALLACLLWGSAYPAIKNGFAMFNIGVDDTASKVLFAGYRFFLAGIVVLIFSVCTQSARVVFSLSRRDYVQLFMLGMAMTAIQYTFFYIGLSHTTGVKGSILNSTTSFFGVLIAHFCYVNDRLKWYTVVGCLLGFAGVMVINFDPALLNFEFTLTGEGFVMISAFMLSAGGVYGKWLSQKMDSVTLTGWQLTFGGAALVAVGFGMGGEVTNFTLASTSLLIYMVLMSAVAFAVWTVLLKYNRVSTISIFTFTIPLFGTLLSALFLDEHIFEWKNLLALVLVCCGVTLVTSFQSLRTLFTRKSLSQ